MSEWPRIALSEIAELEMGQSPPGSTYNVTGEGLLFIQGSAEFGTRHPTPEKWCSEPRKVAKVGDLMMSVRAPVGDLNFADQEIAIGRGLAIIRGNEATITPYLALALGHEVAELQRHSSGGMFASITKKSLAAVRLPVPPLEVQRRIVDLIDHIDRAVERAGDCTVAAVGALDSLRNGLDASHDIALGEIAAVRSGPSWKAKDESAVPTAESRPVLKITNTRPDGTIHLDEVAYVADLPDSTMTLTPRSLVAIRTNGNRDRIGNVYIPPPETEGFAVSAFQMILEVSDRYDRDLLFHYLAAPKIQTLMSDSASGTTGLGNLAVRWLRKLPVPDPVSGQVQQLDAALETIRAARAYQEKLTAARSAMLNGLVSGSHLIPESYDRILMATDEQAA
jgi:restriction endonuclease S subunit